MEEIRRQVARIRSILEPRPVRGLTARQQAVLTAMRRHMDEVGAPPSIRELAVDVGVASTNAIMDHLKALERKHAVVRLSGKLRTRAYVPVGYPIPRLLLLDEIEALEALLKRDQVC